MTCEKCISRVVTALFLVVGMYTLQAAEGTTEGLKSRIQHATNDTLRLVQLDSLCLIYAESELDSAIRYADLALNQARRLGLPLNEAAALNMLGYALLNKGEYPGSLQALLRALEIAEHPESLVRMIPLRYRKTKAFNPAAVDPDGYQLQIQSFILFHLGVLYENMNEPQTALDHYQQALHLGQETRNARISGASHMNLARILVTFGQLDSAVGHAQLAYELFLTGGVPEFLGSALLNLGRTHLAAGDTAGAVSSFNQAIRVSTDQKYLRGVVAANLLLSQIHLQSQEYDSAHVFMHRALETAQSMQAPDLELRAYLNSARYYQAVREPDSVVKYLTRVISIKDSLFNTEQTRRFQEIEYDAERRQEEIRLMEKDFHNRLKSYALLGGMIIFVAIAVILWRSNRHKQRSNVLLQQQRDEIEAQKAQVESALSELRAAQAQLIQKEKMASLGELTAGIAHEIQNPLNFVTNFSELNTELINELDEEIRAGNLDEIRILALSIRDNEQKVVLHGKRADAIVKNMLMHSHASSGKKELTDLNVLCDEYLRLAYHGLRAKDKSFHAEFRIEPDPALPKVEVVPQDIGRVILNLINNAFHAVSAKASETQTESAGDQKQGAESSYKPEVIVSTKYLISAIEIRVKDNGNGIPKEILDKIFQPFFTTKPTGQGTGLGLSLSYDIARAHRGDLTVSTQQGLGSVFILTLPA